MTWKTDAIKMRLGLDSSRRGGSRAPVVLTGASTDPRSGSIASLLSTTKLDEQGAPSEINLSYLRHLPYGATFKENKISIKFRRVPGGRIEAEKIMLQSKQIYPPNPALGLPPETVREQVNVVIEAVSRINNLLRNQGSVEDAARILLKDLRLAELTGENFKLNGLLPQGTFEPVSASLRGAFNNAANDLGDKPAPPFTFKGVSLDELKTLLGFRINTLDADRNHSNSRPAYAFDSNSKVGYMSGVRVRNGADKLDMEIYVAPEDIPDGVEARPLPNFIKFSFAKSAEGYVLREAQFDGRRIDITDRKTLLSIIGLAQDANADLAKRKYPDFMGLAQKYGLLDRLSQLPVPKPLSEGGDMMYVSQFGSGVNKRVEQFGDQIGINAVFLHRGTREDGSISEVGVQVDAAYASGGPNSGYDGAIADPFVFNDQVKVICITHKHYDHKGGLKYLGMIGQNGMLRGKTIVCEERDKYFIEKDLANIPPRNRPKIIALDKEGAMPVKDDDGNVRFWIQYCPLATEHSARCTPYKIIGCVNDGHYNGSALIYGDSRGLREDKLSFFQREGMLRLPEQAAALGYKVTPEKIDKSVTVALHDTTAVGKKGRSVEYGEIRDNIMDLVDMFQGMNVLPAPISTNDMEYMAFLEVAAAGWQQRNVTAVGANAEKQLTANNIYGVDPHLKLGEKRLDPHEEGAKGAAGLIPRHVLDAYAEFLIEKKGLKDLIDLDDVDDEDMDKADTLKKNGALRKMIDKAVDKFVHHYHTADSPNPFFSSTEAYMLRSLMANDAVTFEDDADGFLMWKSIEARSEWAPVRKTRGSKTAKDFRAFPGNLMGLTTGTQGNAEEKFSTVQKLINYFSLFDADERVRSTGYKIDMKNSVVIISQSAIPGNDDSQRRMVTALAKRRDTTVVCAFEGGYTVYNPKGRYQDMEETLTRQGARVEPDGYGNLIVYGKPIHFNGHGKEQDMEKLALSIDAGLHAPHHIPETAAVSSFNAVMDRNDLPRAQGETDDFKLMLIDQHQENPHDTFRCVGRLNPSYYLLREVRPYGQQYNPTLEGKRVELVERNGYNRADGLMAAMPSNSNYIHETPMEAWEKSASQRIAHNTPTNKRRSRVMGPSEADRTPPQTPRSKPLNRAVPVKRRAA